MRLSKIFDEHKKLLTLVSLVILFIYGITQVKIVGVIQNICFKELEGFSYLVVSFSKIMMLFAGLLTVAFVTLVTSIFYELFFLVDVEKSEVFILASFGFIIYFFLYIVISIFLKKLNFEYLLGNLSIDNLKANESYLWIQRIKTINSVFYYIYLVIGMRFLAKDTWFTTLKYTFVLATVFIIQVFVFQKGI